MSLTNQSLLFDIDVEELEQLRQLFEATPKEMLASYNRAVARTSVTMKARSTRLMRDEMGAKSTKAIRKRMQSHRYSFRLGKSDSKLDELKLWYGLNDMSISRLKGRVSRIGSKRAPKGASFTSQRLGSHSFDSGFVARLGGRRSIFSRKGAARFPVHEAQVSISDQLHTDLEDDVMADLPEVFMHHYSTDLQGRVVARGVIQSRQSKWNKFT